jgi:hypothetical protein
MDKVNQKWPAIRFVHLPGGCRAINGQDPVVFIEPHIIGGKKYQFEISTYGTIYKSLVSLGLRIVGVDFISHVLEANGSMPPNWRSFHKVGNTCWPTEEVAQKWRNIAHAAFVQKKGKFWDCGSRIGHQLRVCDWRLREISEAYRNQLFAKFRDNDFKIGQKYADGFTWLSYLTIQSFLVDACILRDYLSEFLSEFIYNKVEDVVSQNITTMGILRKKVLNKITEPDNFTQELKADTGIQGWLTELGNYRDLVVHSAPLAQAEYKLFSICDALPIVDVGLLPIIRCPIPQDPATILSSRSKGHYFEDFEKLFNLFIGADKWKEPMLDGLDYASNILGRLAILSEKIANKSPIEPQMPVFDESNIIGEVKITKHKQ